MGMIGRIAAAPVRIVTGPAQAGSVETAVP